jgi:protein O-mannosyl-transferase
MEGTEHRFFEWHNKPRCNLPLVGGFIIPLHVLFAVLLALCLFAVYGYSLSNLFTNWDDISYVRANSIIHDLSPSSLLNIFTTPVLGNYHPITILTYALEYKFVQDAPWLYHFDNLLLHLSVCWLVYRFAGKLFNNTLAGFLIALFFGLHPMHTESVAWVSARKDLLYSAFYLAALIVYDDTLSSLPPKRNWKYWGVSLFFLLSVLSKPVGITLSVALLLLDWLRKGKINKSALLSKIPFFVIAIVFGFVSIKCQAAIGAVGTPSSDFPLLQRIVFSCYALANYVYKFVVPVPLSCFYPYPIAHGEILPWFWYIYFTVPVLLGFFIASLWKANRIAAFGMLFFLLNMVLYLQLLPVGDAIVAERYSYLGYLGLLFVPAAVITNIAAKSNKILQLSFAAMGLCLIIYFSFVTFRQSLTWFDGISIWRNQIQHTNPPAQTAYDNIGAAYFDKWYNANNKSDRKQYFDSAMFFLRQSRSLWPNNINPCQPLAILFTYKKQYDSANYYMKIAVDASPTVDNWMNYGNFLVMINNPEAATEVYRKINAMQPDLLPPYINRSKLLIRLKRWDEAWHDLAIAASLNRSDGELFYLRSLCDTQRGLKSIALRDVQQAIRLGYNKVDTNYYNWLLK